VAIPAAAGAGAGATTLFAMARAAGELDSEAFSHEVGSIFNMSLLASATSMGVIGVSAGN
jgi:hypothetical protein